MKSGGSISSPLLAVKHFSQMRAVDAQRTKNRLGMLEDDYWDAIERAISIELGFSEAFQ